MIIQNISQASLTDISFTVPRADLRKAVDLVQRMAKEIDAKSVAVTEVDCEGVAHRSGHAVPFRPCLQERSKSCLGKG